MQNTPRRRGASPQLVAKRSLQLAKEHIRTLTSDELPLAIGGSCPTGSWPSNPTQRAQC